MNLPFDRAAARFTIIVGAAIFAGTAFGHATFEHPTATQNSGYKAVLRVPHGCNGEATHTVRIAIPEGIIAVKPMPKSGWKLETKTGEFSRRYNLYGNEISSGVKEIIWSGGTLPDDQYDEFVFQARITDALPADAMVFIPVIQECANGKAAWTEIAAKGADSHDLKAPAPGIRILAQAKPESGHAHGTHVQPSTYKIGAMLIEQPWSRATPGAARVAGGFMKITNLGTAPDRLIGGSADVARVFELHEMAMEGSVMKMRALPNGLEIKPGQTVELKPGGYHVMFIDLKSPVKADTMLRGELIFEKAGRVAIEYRIEALGGANSGEHKH